MGVTATQHAHERQHHSIHPPKIGPRPRHVERHPAYHPGRLMKFAAVVLAIELAYATGLLATTSWFGNSAIPSGFDLALLISLPPVGWLTVAAIWTEYSRA